jgi:hypothetical protein
VLVITSVLVKTSVLVIVVTVARVEVTVMRVVHVVAVLDGAVTAALLVGMLVASVRQVRYRVLVVVVFMRRVGMAVVDVVHMTFALDAGVAAPRAMLVRMGGMDIVVRHHASSLLCWTASATMRATC